MKSICLKAVLNIDEAVSAGIIGEEHLGRLKTYLRDILYETYQKISSKMALNELEKLNISLADTYGHSIKSLVKFRFMDITKTYFLKIKECTLRYVSFDLDNEDIKAVLVIESEQIELVQFIKNYALVRNEEFYGRSILTFTIDNELMVSVLDENNLAD